MQNPHSLPHSIPVWASWAKARRLHLRLWHDLSGVLGELEGCTRPAGEGALRSISGLRNIGCVQEIRAASFFYHVRHRLCPTENTFRCYHAFFHFFC